MIFSRNGRSELGRTRLDAAAVRGEDERRAGIAFLNSVVHACYFRASEFIKSAISVRRSPILAENSP